MSNGGTAPLATTETITAPAGKRIILTYYTSSQQNANPGVIANGVSADGSEQVIPFYEVSYWSSGGIPDPGAVTYTLQTIVIDA